MCVTVPLKYMALEQEWATKEREDKSTGDVHSTETRVNHRRARKRG